MVEAVGPTTSASGDDVCDAASSTGLLMARIQGRHRPLAWPSIPSTRALSAGRLGGMHLAMTPMEDSYLVPLHAPVDLASVISSGHSRIIVHHPHSK